MYIFAVFFKVFLFFILISALALIGVNLPRFFWKNCAMKILIKPAKVDTFNLAQFEYVMLPPKYSLQSFFPGLGLYLKATFRAWDILITFLSQKWLG